VISIAVVREVQAMITGESASPEMRAKIRAFLNSQPEVEEVYNIISIQWGADLMLAVKAKMAPMPSAEAMVDAINAVEERLQSELKVRWVFFEPDIKK
jgi:divalent metal cation (Fe/Co/Zn/Cd) transporter